MLGNRAAAWGRAVGWVPRRCLGARRWLGAAALPWCHRRLGAEGTAAASMSEGESRTAAAMSEEEGRATGDYHGPRAGGGGGGGAGPPARRRARAARVRCVRDWGVRRGVGWGSTARPCGIGV